MQKDPKGVRPATASAFLGWVENTRTAARTLRSSLYTTLLQDPSFADLNKKQVTYEHANPKWVSSESAAALERDSNRLATQLGQIHSEAQQLLKTHFTPAALHPVAPKEGVMVESDVAGSPKASTLTTKSNGVVTDTLGKLISEPHVV